MSCLGRSNCAADIPPPTLLAVSATGLYIDAYTRQVYVNGELLNPPLSVKQFNLLCLLYQNQGRAVSKDEIAYAVWPELEGEVYDASIDRMISRIRSRIELETEKKTRLIATVRGYGYRLIAS